MHNDAANATHAGTDILIDDLRRRLRPVCREWGNIEFEALIERIVTLKMRWRAAGYDG